MTYLNFIQSNLIFLSLVCTAASCKVTFGGNEVIKTYSTSVLLKIPQRVKSHCMRKQYQSVTSSTKNTLRAPTLWLSIFHFCALHRSFLFARSYYYYQGNFSSHPLTWRVPLPQHDAGVSQHFSDRGRTTPTTTGGGGISHRPICTYRNIRPAFHLKFVYLLSDFPGGFDKVSNFISSYTVLPFTWTASCQCEIPTILKKRDTHDLKETGVHMEAVSQLRWILVSFRTNSTAYTATYSHPVVLLCCIS